MKIKNCDERVMIFIDASNLYHIIKKMFNGEKRLRDFNFEKFTNEIIGKRKLVRVYYYTAPLDRLKDKKTYMKQQQFFEKLKQIPNFELVLCRMQKVRIDGKIVYQVKEDDIHLAVDMVKFAYNNAYDTAVLISSDGDFVPAIDAVKEIGKNVENIGFETKFSYYLKQKCDQFRKFNKRFLEDFFNKMNNKLIFLRHAETKKDSSIPVSKWILSDRGFEDAKKVTDIKEFQDIDIIISSGEIKAFQTVKPLADKLSKDIIQIKELGEINRDSGELMTKEEYNEMKKKIFNDLDFTSHGWETCSYALARFKEAVRKIDKQYENKKILISAHGTVMTLYFADLQNKLNDLMKRWKGLGFCDYGIIKDNKVVKDIV